MSETDKWPMPQPDEPFDDNPEWTEEMFANATRGPSRPPTPDEDRRDMIKRLRDGAERLRAEAKVMDVLAERLEIMPVASSYEGDATSDTPHAAE